MNEFTAGECVRFGWETFKKRPWFLIGVALLFSLIGSISSNIASSVTEHGVTGSGFFLTLVDFFIIQIFVSIAQISFFLKAHDSIEGVTLRDAWQPEIYWKFLGASVLSMIIIVLGFILLIVPGVILGLGLIATCYLVVDKKLGAIEALKESWRITKGHKGTLFILILALMGVAILGFLALFVGILVAMPVIFLAVAHAYRILEKKAGSSSSQTEATPQISD